MIDIPGGVPVTLPWWKATDSLLVEYVLLILAVLLLGVLTGIAVRAADRRRGAPE
jgi:hypothetical protein